MDGKIVIGTEVETDDLGKSIRKIENEINKLDRNTASTNEKAQREVEKLEEKYEDLQRQMDGLNLDSYYKEVERINEMYSKMPGLEDKKEEKLEQLDEVYSKQIEKANKLGFQLESIEGKIKNTQESAKRTTEEYAKQKTELEGQLKVSQSELKERERIERNQANITKVLKTTGGQLKDITRKIGRWAISILGVYSAYSLISNAMSTLSQYNEDLSNKLYSIRLMIAGTLEPIVTKIVDIIYRLLSYLNMITKAWFNIDMFAKGQSLSLKDSNKQAKNLQKTLAGFDEINKVSDSSSSGTDVGGGGNQFVPPEDVPVPEWMQWIIDHKDLIIATLLGIAGGIIAIKLGCDLLMGLGIGLIIAGIVLLIQDIIDFIKDPSWDKFADILIDLAIILAGVAIAMLAVNAANPVAWIILAIAAVVALVAVIIKNWDKIKAVLGKVWDWINEKIVKPIVNGFNNLKDKVVNAFTTVKDKVSDIFTKIKNKISDIISGIVEKFKAIGSKVGDAIGSAFKTAINGVLQMVENILNTPIKAINKLLDVINKVPGVSLGKLTTLKLPRLKTGGIINQPGRGVPVGGAIGGEAGREGVIPLTDSQAMEELGRSIGKYININLTNVTKLDNRQIAREQKIINAQSDFAFNR